MSTKLKIDVQSLNIDWSPSTNYYITVEEGVVQAVGESGLINPEQILTFTTPALPIISSTVPGNLASNITATTIKMVFDRETIFTGSGNIKLYKDASPSDVLVSTIAMNSSRVTLSGNEITVSLLGLIEESTTYYILLDSGVIKDIFDFNSSSVLNENTFRFTTAPGPQIQTLTPSNGSVNVATNTLKIQFNTSNIEAVSGNLYIYEVGQSSDTLKYTISIGDPKITFSPANTLNIDVTNLLDFDKTYYVTADAGIIRNTTNYFKFAGISSTNVFRFTREAFAENASGTVLYNTNKTAIIYNTAPVINDSLDPNSTYQVEITSSASGSLSLISSYGDTGSALIAKNTLSVRGQETVLTGIFVKPDGTKLWTIGSGQDRIQQYSLITPWDLSTALLDSVRLDVFTQDNTPEHMFFKADGTAVYIVGNQNDSIRQYDLGAAWDLTTATFNNKSFSVASQTTVPGGIYFRPDGTRFWITSQLTNGKIFEYNLASAWDITTASYSGKSDIANNSSGIWFRDDGLAYFISTSTPTVIERPLAVAWDITSRVFDTVSIGVNAVAAGFDFISFQSQGKAYAVDSSATSIVEYDTVRSSYASNKLTINGTKANINYFLRRLLLVTANSYSSNFTLNYLFTKGSFSVTKTQAVNNSASAVIKSVDNLDVTRTYNANTSNQILTTSKLVINENDSSNPDYTVTFSCTFGGFTVGNVSDNTTAASSISYTGKKTDVNDWLSQSLTSTLVRFWPNNNVSQNGNISFVLQKNGVNFLTADIPLQGVARSNADTLVTFNTSNSSYNPGLELTRYYTLDILAVGGGGGGGKGGGGGGGEVVETLNLTPLQAAYNITIGAGGAGALAGAVATASSGSAGSATTVSASGLSISAGGGIGGSGVYATTGNASGGNAGGSIGSAGGFIVQNSYTQASIFAGGGGGAAAGSAGLGGSGIGAKSFNGGSGKVSTITGSTYGGGGGAGNYQAVGTRLGGAGGGGSGQTTSTSTVPTAGTANTGGGGGGGNISTSVAGAAGGSGVVVFRFKQKT